MEYTTDTSFMMVVFILPALFGLSLLGEGISKIMNYDSRGWVGICAGCGFIGVLIIAYFMITFGKSFL